VYLIVRHLRCDDGTWRSTGRRKHCHFKTSSSRSSREVPDGIAIKDRKTGEERELALDGLFAEIGCSQHRLLDDLVT